MRCLRCGAGNEWITTQPAPKQTRKPKLSARGQKVVAQIKKRIARVGKQQ